MSEGGRRERESVEERRGAPAGPEENRGERGTGNRLLRVVVLGTILLAVVGVLLIASLAMQGGLIGGAMEAGGGNGREGSEQTGG